jgi:beta-aspartyl-peptidase (threonine type)
MEDDAVFLGAKCYSMAFIAIDVACLLNPVGHTIFGQGIRESLNEPVRQVLDSQVAAWNKGDLKGFMDGYWKSDKLTFFSVDKVEHGWQATYDRYQKRYQAEGREMGKLSFSDLDIQMLGDDTAWVRGRWKLVLSKESPGGLFTLIFKKLPEGWKIVHDHTSAGQ